MVPHPKEGQQDHLTLAMSNLLRKRNVENASVSNPSPIFAIDY